MLGNPHAVDDGGGFRGTKNFRGLDDIFRRNAGNLRAFFRRIFRYDFLKFLEPFGSLIDESRIMPIPLQDHVHHAVEQRHIGPQVLAHIKVCVRGQLNFSGIGDHQLGAFLFGPVNSGGHQRMARCGIGANYKDAFGILDLIDGIGHGATSKRCGKTCHSGGVSETRAMVHIVGSHRGPGKFLEEIILLVGDLGGS